MFFKLTREFHRFFLTGDTNGYNNLDEILCEIQPGIPDLKLWISDEDGKALNLVSPEKDSFILVIVVKIYS